MALGALSTACFISVTSENLPVALLRPLAAGLEVSEPAVGLLMTGYALVVALTTIPLVAITARWDRRTTAFVTVASIALSNLVLALAPNYPIAVIARLVAAVGHGVFWSVVAAMAARLLGPGQAGRATAVVFAGNSLAFLLGLPLTSWLSQLAGWRGTVLVMAGVAAVAALLIRTAIRPMPAEGPAARPDLAAVGRVLTARRLIPVNLATLLVVTGHFAAFTYITPIITDYVQLTGTAAAGLLLAYGAAGVLGLILLGRTIDRHPRGTALLVTGGIAACTLVLLLLGPGSGLPAGIVVVLWSVPAAGIGVILQAAVLRAAPAEPDLASAVYVVAFQIGIALGAWAGGVSLGLGLLPMALGIAVTGGLLAVLAVRRSAAFSRAAAEPELCTAGRTGAPH